ncbi:MAG: rhodanese-like domain-containing protein [Gammaproteobacteria bacterium]|nr:rhodanese-like domain-containing protein [Gammaproteobacteria bacterium]
MQHTSRFLNLTAAALKTIQEISVPEVKALLAQDPHSVCLIDVREESEWARGHAGEAIHLSKGVIERDIEKTIPNIDTLLVLYCGGGYRSALAAENLHRMGYRNVRSMAGGWSAWNT